MTPVAEKELQHLGETSGCSDCDHDLVHELSRRLDSLGRIDQYIANAIGTKSVQDFWRTVKQQEQSKIGKPEHRQMAFADTSDTIRWARHEEQLEHAPYDRRHHARQDIEPIAQDRNRENDRLALAGKIAVGMCHDLANLLMPLRDCVCWLRGRSLPGACRERADLASQCAEEMAVLIRDMQLLTQCHDRPREPRTLDLPDWWKQTHRLFRALVPRRIALDSRFAPDLPPFRVVEADLFRAVLNLVVNAADAIMGAGLSGRTILVWSESRDNTVEIGVKDDGPGIPPEFLEYIFEPLFTTKKNGTGMGLSIVNDFVQACNGSISVVSTINQGATFVMSLPLSASTSTD